MRHRRPHRLVTGCMALAVCAAMASTPTWAQRPAPAPSPTPGVAPAAAELPAVSRAQEEALKRVLSERIPRLGTIDEVRRSPIAGLLEVRFNGTELLYADPTGDFIVVQGAIIETRTRTDLTEQRMEKLLAIDFNKLPLKDAIVIKQGKGTRRLVVFSDPNCGYCKRLERDLQNLKDVTIYNYVYAILGPDSTTKARDIFCAKDPAKTWRAWMIDGVLPPTADSGCNAATLDRVVDLGRRNKVNGTPAIVFEDGSRKPGALPLDALERLMADATAAVAKPRR